MMKAVAIAALLALPAHASRLDLDARPWAAEQAAWEQAAQRVGFQGEGEMSYIYDDNVFRLPAEEIAALESVTPISAVDERQRYAEMAAAEDHIVRYRAAFYEQHAYQYEGFATRLGAGWEYFQHQRNMVKSYASWDFSLRQYVMQDHFIEFIYSYRPGQFERNFLGETSAGTRFPGIYNEWAWVLRVRSRPRIEPRAEIMVSLENAWAKHRHPQLRYRNWATHRYLAEFAWRFTPAVRAFADYGYESLGAGRVSNAVLSDDHSFEEHSLGFGGTYIPMPKVELTLRYRWLRRLYTSTLGAAADPFHDRREDDEHRLGAEATWTPLDWLKAWIRYDHQSHESDLPDAAALQRPADPAHYGRNLFSLGLSARWSWQPK